MISLLLATNNSGKKKELEHLLGGFRGLIRLRTLEEMGVEHDVVEDGSTFIENARKKAVEFAQLTGSWALGDDSGLCVDALGGEPGIRSARFAGEPRDQAKNNRLLLEKLEGIPEEKRSAHFTCALVLADAKGVPKVEVEGHCEGFILPEPSGTGGFGYDPLFYYPPLKKSFAELNQDQKNEVSHRGRALKELKARVMQMVKF